VPKKVVWFLLTSSPSDSRATPMKYSVKSVLRTAAMEPLLALRDT
jgi:hypothetical protein